MIDLGKNDDPHGCPDRVIGRCEAICATCHRPLGEVDDMASRRDRVLTYLAEHEAGAAIGVYLILSPALIRAMLTEETPA